MAKKDAAPQPAGRNATLSDVHLMAWEKPAETAPVADDSQESDSEQEHADDSELGEAQAAVEALEGDEADDEDDAEQSEDDVDGDEDDVEEPAKPVEFDIDGERVTLDELKKGRLREADYTRKTQELAAHRKAVEAEQAQYRSARDQYAGQLQHLEAALKEAMPKEQDWDALRAEDPVEFAASWADHQRRAEQLKAVQAQQARIQQEQQQDWQRQRNANMEAGRRKLLEAKPEWNDPAKAEEDARSLAAYAHTSYGWTNEVLETIEDPNFVILLDKAKRWDDMQKNGKAAIANKLAPSATLKPGSRSANAPRKGAQKAIESDWKKLKNSGSKSAAQALVEKMLD